MTEKHAYFVNLFNTSHYEYQTTSLVVNFLDVVRVVNVVLSLFQQFFGYH